MGAARLSSPSRLPLEGLESIGVKPSDIIQSASSPDRDYIDRRARDGD